MDNLLNSEDVHYMLGALRTLGLQVEEQSENKRVIVQGCGGQFPAGNGSVGEVQLFLGNVGTAMRPLTAAVTAAGGNARFVKCFIIQLVQANLGITLLQRILGCFFPRHNLFFSFLYISSVKLDSILILK